MSLSPVEQFMTYMSLLLVKMLRLNIRKFCSRGPQQVCPMYETPSTQTGLMRTLKSKEWLIQLGTEEAYNERTMKVAIS